MSKKKETEENLIYLDNAATTWPKPQLINQAVESYFSNCYGSQRRTNHDSFDINSLREKILHYFDASDEYLVMLLPSATIGMNLVINSLHSLKYHIITSNIEHHCVYRPLNEKKVSYKVANILLKDLNINYDELLKFNNFNTYSKNAVILNHGSNVIGSVIDLALVNNMLKNLNTLLIVDASQTAGIVEISMKKMGIDILVAGAHKHLFGLPGVGFVIFKKNINLEPLYFGGTGKFSSNMFQPRDFPDLYEAGTYNLPGLLALDKSLDYFTPEKKIEINKYEEMLLEYFIKNAKSIKGLELYYGKKKRTSVLSFTLFDLDPTFVIGPYLYQKGNIIVRAGLHCAPLVHQAICTYPSGTVRISFSPFNTIDEINKLLNLLEILKKSYYNEKYV